MCRGRGRQAGRTWRAAGACRRGARPRSRRIDDEHRLVCRVDEKEVNILEVRYYC
ncbi:type II toxin-antitoxin system YoeB family toxin [Streptomyces sp. NPDC002144]